MSTKSAAMLHVRYARVKRSDAPSRARTSAATAQSTSGGTTSGTKAASTLDPKGRGTQMRYASSSAAHTTSTDVICDRLYRAKLLRLAGSPDDEDAIGWCCPLRGCADAGRVYLHDFRTGRSAGPRPDFQCLETDRGRPEPGLRPQRSLLFPLPLPDLRPRVQ